jgi:hypothetical protein
MKQPAPEAMTVMFWNPGSYVFWKQCQDLMMLLTGLDPVWGIWN